MVDPRNDATAGSNEPRDPRDAHRSAPNPAGASGSKKDTSRIELSDAEAPTEAPGETLTVQDALAGSKGKSETSRIRLEEARTEAGGESVPPAKDSTSRILFGQEDESDSKDGTARIVLGSGDSQPMHGSLRAAAKDATVRVDLTGLIEQGAAKPPEEEAVRLPGAHQTARIEIPAGAAPAAPPRTVRLQRPPGSPKTVILKRPGEGPGAGAPAKSETTRISIPEGAVPEAPAAGGQRKTIMIRRGAGSPPGGPRTLTIQRPAPQAAGESKERDMAEILASLESGDQPGAAFSLLALAAVLVLGVLLYVLAAQTLAPGLPFPGRIL